jgi:hypothetical protein
MDESFETQPPQHQGSSREVPPAGADETKAVAKGAPKARTKRKLTDEKQIEICAMIGVGCSLRTAARLAGCSEAAVRNLVRRDEAFAARFREAAIRREVLPLRNIINAGQTRWRAAAWYLARLNPEEYGYRKPQTVTPQMIKDWVRELSGAIVQAVEDDATLARLANVLKGLSPKKDQRDEMQSVMMPPGYDADAEWEGSHADQAYSGPRG